MLYNWLEHLQMSQHLMVIRSAAGIVLTHWGRVTHICIGKLNIIASDNGLSPRRRQAIIWTNAGILLIKTFRNKLQWNCIQKSNIFIQGNAFENVVCEMAAICLGLNVLTAPVMYIFYKFPLAITEPG